MRGAFAKRDLRAPALRADSPRHHVLENVLAVECVDRRNVEFTTSLAANRAGDRLSPGITTLWVRSPAAEIRTTRSVSNRQAQQPSSLSMLMPSIRLSPLKSADVRPSPSVPSAPMSYTFDRGNHRLRQIETRSVGGDHHAVRELDIVGDDYQRTIGPDVNQASRCRFLAVQNARQHRRRNSRHGRGRRYHRGSRSPRKTGRRRFRVARRSASRPCSQTWS